MEGKCMRGFLMEQQSNIIPHTRLVEREKNNASEKAASAKGKDAEQFLVC